MQRFSVIFILFLSCIASAESLRDEDLLEIAKEAFDRRFEVKNLKVGIQVMRDTMEGLDDAERTRAMALRLYELDESDGRMRSNTFSSATNAMADDPTLIEDPSELKRMIAAEPDARRFYLLSAMAIQLMNSQKADFIPEMTPMLYRTDQVVRMSPDSSYYSPIFENVSFVAYGVIKRNLELLGADFVPPDEKLPFEERIPILIEWLKENWPGCEHLSVPGTGQPHGRGGTDTVGVAERPRVRPEPGGAPPEDSSVAPVRWSWVVAMVIVVLSLVVWWKVLRRRVL